MAATRISNKLFCFEFFLLQRVNLKGIQKEIFSSYLIPGILYLAITLFSLYPALYSKRLYGLSVFKEQTSEGEVA